MVKFIIGLFAISITWSCRYTGPDDKFAKKSRELGTPALYHHAYQKTP